MFWLTIHLHTWPDFQAQLMDDTQSFSLATNCKIQGLMFGRNRNLPIILLFPKIKSTFKSFKSSRADEFFNFWIFTVKKYINILKPLIDIFILEKTGTLNKKQINVDIMTYLYFLIIIVTLFLILWSIIHIPHHSSMRIILHLPNSFPC